MSDLRQQLDAARTEYLLARYRGDLAAELLHRPRRIVPWTIITTAITGIAAALFFWLGAPGSHETNKPTSVAPAQFAVAPATQEYVETIIMPTMPNYFEITPAAEQLTIPAMPAFPSVDYAADFPSTEIIQESA